MIKRKEYTEVMNDDHKKFLLKRRRYGWGWIPVTWQGWAIIFLQVAIIFIAAMDLPTKPIQPTADQLLRFFVLLGIAFANLLLIGLQVGPVPRWRWGKKDSDNPDEDF